MQPFRFSHEDLHTWVSWMLFEADSETEGILWWNNRERRWIVHTHLSSSPSTTTALQEHKTHFPHQNPGEIIPFIARPVSTLTALSPRGPTLDDLRQFIEGDSSRCMLLTPEGYYVLKKLSTSSVASFKEETLLAFAQRGTTLMDEHRWASLHRIGIRVTRFPPGFAMSPTGSAVLDQGSRWSQG